MCKGQFLKLNLSELQFSSLVPLPNRVTCDMSFQLPSNGWSLNVSPFRSIQPLKSIESPEGSRCQDLSQHSQLRSRGILKLPGTQMEPWTTQYDSESIANYSSIKCWIKISSSIQHIPVWSNHTNSFCIECVHLRINATLTHSVSNGVSKKLQNTKALIRCPTRPNGESRSSIIAASMYIFHCHAIQILSCRRYSLVGVYSRFRLFKVPFPFWKRHDKACD